MSDRCLVDTNLILRLLVRDNIEQADIATRFFLACDRGEVVPVFLPTVVAECVFTLESFYQIPRHEIAEKLTYLLSRPGVKLADAAEHFDALDRYASSNLHFVDCLLAAIAVANQQPVATFDRGFKRFSDVPLHPMK